MRGTGACVRHLPEGSRGLSGRAEVGAAQALWAPAAGIGAGAVCAAARASRVVQLLGAETNLSPLKEPKRLLNSTCSAVPAATLRAGKALARLPCGSVRAARPWLPLGLPPASPAAAAVRSPGRYALSLAAPGGDLAVQTWVLKMDLRPVFWLQEFSGPHYPPGPPFFPQ